MSDPTPSAASRPAPLTWQELAAALRGIAHLATVRPDGRPHVAVVAPLVDGDSVWLFTNRSSVKAANLAVEPRLALVWRSDGEAYLEGVGRFVEDGPTKARLWSHPGLGFDPASFFGTVQHPDFALIAVEARRATLLQHGPQGPSRRTWTA